MAGVGVCSFDTFLIYVKQQHIKVPLALRRKKKKMRGWLLCACVMLIHWLALLFLFLESGPQNYHIDWGTRPTPFCRITSYTLLFL